MESWREGRDELFVELTKICNRIDRNVVAEIDEENFTRVGHDELRALQERASRVSDLVEENTRLADKLKEQRFDNVRVQELENENKRLGEELQSLKGEKEPLEAKEKLDGPARSATPTSTGLEAKLPGKGRDIDKYNAVVTKHNTLHTSHQKIKDDREKLIQAVRERNAEIDRMEKVIKSRERKIEALKKKLGTREWKTKDMNGEGGVSGPVPNSSKALAKDDAARVEYQDAAVPTGLPDQSEVEKATRSPIYTKVRLIEGDDGTSRRSSASSSEVNHPMCSNSPMLPNLLGEGQMPIEETQYVDLTQMQPKPRSQPNLQQHSDSTEGEPLSPARNIKAEVASTTKTSEVPSSPDTPLVVSARCIRKRKRRGDENESTSPVKVKIEEIELITSSPIGLAALRHIDHTDSLDLDEIGEKVDTPKKRQRLMELSEQASRISAGNGVSSNHDRVTTNNSPLSQRVISTQHSDVSIAASPLQPLNRNQLLLPRTSKIATPKSRPLVSDMALNILSEDSETVSHSSRTSKPNVDTSGRLHDLLTRPSPPKRILGQVYEPPTRHFANRGTDRSSSLQPDTAKERNNVINTSSASTTNELRKSLEPWQSSMALLASTNLTRPSSDGSDRSGRGLLQRAKPHVTVGLSLKLSSTLVTPKSRHIQKVAPRPIATTTRNPPHRLEEPLIPLPKQQHTTPITYKELSDYGIDPEEEPLRRRPLETLRLSDFKVNPEANQGLDYAFTDVVRNRADRRCLPGCTKPECCGTSFRALAEMMMDNPTKSQEEHDQDLLEDFMGNNVYKLQNMTTAEREEMLLQAKTRDMANKYGRHRHAYERKRSPPGFWDADFPTTQEHLAEREKANEREREMIEKRYNEAMRPGGAYIFQDER